MILIYIYFLNYLWNFKSMAILVSQSNPLNPAGHSHVYEATPSWHVPPLLQGSPMQSSISEIYKKIFYYSDIKRKNFTYLKRVEEFHRILS